MKASDAAMDAPLQNALNPESIAMLRQKPWLNAAPGSIWLITGKVRWTFHLAGILAHRIGDERDRPEFQLHDDENTMVSAHDIQQAQELLLTYASDPLTAFHDRDQELIDRALEDRA